MRRIAALVSLALLLTGCAPAGFTANVTRFTALPPAAGPGGGKESFTILPDHAQVGSLEFEHYADLVAAQLSKRGWRPLPAGHHAKAVVRLHWQLGAPALESFDQPEMPGPWCGGLMGPCWSSYSLTVWPKQVEVDILDGRAWRHKRTRMIWQGRAVATGGGQSIAPAMPYLIRALFTGFPGNDGQTVRVTVPLSEQ